MKEQLIEFSREMSSAIIQSRRSYVDIFPFRPAPVLAVVVVVAAAAAPVVFPNLIVHDGIINAGTCLPPSIFDPFP